MRSLPNYTTWGLPEASLESSVRYLSRPLGPKDIRVNGISAGPIKTLWLPASKVGKVWAWSLGQQLSNATSRSDDVGNVAAFLLSDLAAGVSAEITYVDGGFAKWSAA